MRGREGQRSISNKPVSTTNAAKSHQICPVTRCHRVWPPCLLFGVTQFQEVKQVQYEEITGIFAQDWKQDVVKCIKEGSKREFGSALHLTSCFFFFSFSLSCFDYMLTSSLPTALQRWQGVKQENTHKTFPTNTLPIIQIHNKRNTLNTLFMKNIYYEKF